MLGQIIPQLLMSITSSMRERAGGGGVNRETPLFFNIDFASCCTHTRNSTLHHLRGKKKKKIKADIVRGKVSFSAFPLAPLIHSTAQQAEHNLSTLLQFLARKVELHVLHLSSHILRKQSKHKKATMQSQCREAPPKNSNAKHKDVLERQTY